MLHVSTFVSKDQRLEDLGDSGPLSPTGVMYFHITKEDRIFNFDSSQQQLVRPITVSRIPFTKGYYRFLLTGNYRSSHLYYNMLPANC